MGVRDACNKLLLERDASMANTSGPTHAEVRDRLLREGSAELRQEYTRLRPRRAAIAAVIRTQMRRKVKRHKRAE